MKNRNFILFVMVLFPMVHMQWSMVYAQSAFDIISRNLNLSASNYCIYPDSSLKALTPAPEGKKPFYISHYGRHGSRYLITRKGYDIPYDMLRRADSLGILTEKGKEAYFELRQIIEDSEGRWGDLTGLGKKQHRQIARRMMERFPEVFAGKAYVDAKSTTSTRCILSMGSAIQQLVALNPLLQVTMKAAKRDMLYMNHQDTILRNQMESPRAIEAYDSFEKPYSLNHRLMEVLFTHPDSASKVVDESWLNYYLLKTALIQQNTHMEHQSKLIELFSLEDIHCFWLRENAWWYFMYGPSPLNGGNQPYTQRYLLRQIIHEADSCLRLPKNGASLRFGHETVLLPLTCLLGLNGFDYQTEDLNKLEENGWWACLVFPMASNIQFIFYREDPKDKDILFKVLLNEQEATLPIPTDIAPYYRWQDFRQYYLKKLDDYDGASH